MEDRLMRRALKTILPALLLLVFAGQAEADPYPAYPPRVVEIQGEQVTVYCLPPSAEITRSVIFEREFRGCPSRRFRLERTTPRADRRYPLTEGEDVHAHRQCMGRHEPPPTSCPFGDAPIRRHPGG